MGENERKIEKRFLAVTATLEHACATMTTPNNTRTHVQACAVVQFKQNEPLCLTPPQSESRARSSAISVMNTEHGTRVRPAGYDGSRGAARRASLNPVSLYRHTKPPARTSRQYQRTRCRTRRTHSRAPRLCSTPSPTPTRWFPLLKGAIRELVRMVCGLSRAGFKVNTGRTKTARRPPAHGTSKVPTFVRSLSTTASASGCDRNRLGSLVLPRVWRCGRKKHGIRVRRWTFGLQQSEREEGGGVSHPFAGVDGCQAVGRREQRKRGRRGENMSLGWHSSSSGGG